MAQKGKPGRPPKKTVANKIKDALGAAEDEINRLMPEDVQKQLVPEIQSHGVVDEVPKISKDAKDDYEFARANLHTLLLKGNEVLEGIIELAQESDQPRSYEVAGTVLKTLLEGTRELMSLQKDIRDIEKKNNDEAPTIHVKNAENINSTIVVEGTTMEMLDIFERAKKQKAREDQENADKDV